MKLSVALAIGLALAGCSRSSNEIRAAYISPMAYEAWDCRQIGAEAQRVSHRANQAAGVQDETANKDAVATGVAIVLFWPALFFVSGGDGQNAAELARLKGEFDALEQAAISKRCNIERRGR